MARLTGPDVCCTLHLSISILMVIDMKNDVLLDRLHALADKSRFHILQLMAKGTIATCCDRIEAYENGCCVADVVAVTGLSQPTVSHHLKVLERVGLVRRESRGPWTCYFPNPEALQEVVHALTTELITPVDSHQNEKGACCPCSPGSPTSPSTCETSVNP
ncbi:ArsR/SmtB family transcription factor [Alicyclobacillus sendaiensis]|uniref:ArsR/SmtB family transcription factor n=1 Tax=Alicyclobacillus sendaiensis TaxID=192387 RepID=UPI003D244CF3